MRALFSLWRVHCVWLPQVSSGESDAPTPIKYIVIEMTPVQSIDSTAVHMLEDLHRDLKERGIRLAFSSARGVSGPAAHVPASAPTTPPAANGRSVGPNNDT